MHYYDNADQVAWQAAKYGMLADYYKYMDPRLHVYYYQKHFECMQRWCMMEQQRGEQMGMGGGNPAMVRVIHASPDAPAVDVYVNGQKVLSDISYKQSSDYLQVPGGQYQIDVYPAGKTDQAVVTQNLAVEGGNMYTVAAAGTLDSIRLIAALDNQSVSSGKAKVRFWHLSPNAPAVDIAVKGGDVLFRNVPFGKATRYMTLPPTTADLEVRQAGTNQVVKTVPGVKLEPNQAYTAVAVGLAGKQPPLEALFLQP
ncbi:DUF4397 domain-containing protein [Halobacillus litoralis]|uniref:DUF4397 domain-containing protein n=1 Tax=Halobacillus litoralis TaxID=45668 RepID=UPI001CD48B30|nr:DUF4397 domain-containing protein [Halobacillus litoralis]MCA0972057.1 DUF4397 domain-containing protein [Halobacillus litoralis]